MGWLSVCMETGIRAEQSEEEEEGEEVWGGGGRDGELTENKSLERSLQRERE